MHRHAKAVCLHFARSVQLVFCILVHECLCVCAGVCLTVWPHQSQRDEHDPNKFSHIPYVCVFTLISVTCVYPIAISHLIRSYNLHPHFPPSFISIPPQSPVQPTLMKLIESVIDNA